MAQYYGDEERSQSQLDGHGQEIPPVQRDNEGRSDDHKSEAQAEGYNVYSGEPENASNKEEMLGERTVDGDAPNPLGSKKSDEFVAGSNRTEGESDYPSDVKGAGYEDTGYERSAEQPAYSEERPEEEGARKQYVGEEDKSTQSEFKDGGDVIENAGYASTAEHPTGTDQAGQREYSEERATEDENAPNQDVSSGQRAIRDGYEQSPYTQSETKEDYDKQAYGGGGFRSKTEGEDGEERGDEPNSEQQQMQQQTESAERDFSSPKDDGNEERESEGKDSKGNMKEKILNTLIPCHKTDTLDDDYPNANEAGKSPGFVEKMKEKFSGNKPHDTTPQ